MKPKTIILTTMLLFVLVSFGLLFNAQFSTGSRIPLPKGASETEDRVYSEDGTVLPYTIVRPIDKPLARIILVADESLDRNWNSRSIQYGTGMDLAHSLAEKGYATIRYDQRGSGESILSGLNRPDIQNLTMDLGKIRQLGQKDFPGIPEVILAHGNSCAIVLQGIQKSGELPAGILLTGCAYSGTLLDNWGERLLENMSRSSVDRSVMDQARKDLDHWIASKGSMESVTESMESSDTTGASGDDSDVSPDLLAFYHALDHMDSEKKASWTKKAATIRPMELASDLLRSGVKITQLIGEYDPEIPEGELEATLAYKSKQNLTTYQLLVLDKVDHFLKTSESRPGTVMEKFAFRVDPNKESSGPALLEIGKQIGGFLNH